MIAPPSSSLPSPASSAEAARSSSAAGAMLEETMKTLRTLKKHRKERHARLREITKEDEDEGWRGRGEGGGEGDGEGREHSAVAPLGGELSVKERRIKMAKETHWLAAGSKDGRISLWDIY